MAGRLFKPTLWVGGMTLVSRILGFVRDMLIAAFFGADWITDAFFVAFKVPNFFRRLFTEGAVSHACLPLIEECKNQGGNLAVRRFIGNVSVSLAAALLLFGLVVALLSPLLIAILAPGFAWQSPPHHLATHLLQLCAPYFMLITLVSVFACLLNAYGQYAIPALIPAVLNVVMIMAVIWLSPGLDEPIAALAWAVPAAGLVQLLALMAWLNHLGLLPKIRMKFKCPAISRFYKNLLPSIFSVSITQLNLLLDTLVASMLTAGSVSWLYYSDRLVEFPLGILGITFSTVILPRLAKSYVSGDHVDFSSALDWGLRCVLLVGMPATLGILILAEPMLSTLFQYDEFSARDVEMAGQSLRGYAVGLLGYLLVKVLIPGFTAREDFKTPARFGVYAMWVSLSLNVLAWPFAHAGLALATSLGALANAGLLLKALLKLRVYQPAPGWWLYFVRVIASNLAMSIALCAAVTPDLWLQQSASARAVNLLVVVVLGIGVYFLTLACVGLRPSHLKITENEKIQH